MKENERGKERTASGVIGHTEDSKAVGPFDVEYKAVLRIRDVGVVVAGNFLEDLSGNGAGVRRCCAVLR